MVVITLVMVGPSRVLEGEIEVGKPRVVVALVLWSIAWLIGAGPGARSATLYVEIELEVVFHIVVRHSARPKSSVSAVF